MAAAIVRELVKRLGGSFSRELGIELAAGRELEVFKWFLASFLYGARISTTIAARTYHEFERHKVLTPQRIQETGWDGLVHVLDVGGYVRYDFSTATKLLAVSGDLIERYGGKLGNVHAAADDPRDLERRLQDIGKGIGPVTVNIFLRELRGIWPKAEPLLSDPAVLAAKRLGVVSKKTKSPERALAALEKQWINSPLRASTFVDFEAALVRLGRGYCRKEKHAACPLAPSCPTAGRKRTSR
jgi:endonuclease III